MGTPCCNRNARTGGDIIEDWFRTGATDGFNVKPSIINSQLALFAEEVVPILKKRRLFRK